MHSEENTVFKAAGLDQVAEITALVRAAYAKWVPVIGREPLPMRADYNEALGKHRFDLLMAEGRILGLIETDSRPGHLWIENVAVLPEAQGRGLGRRLLAHAEMLAAGLGHAQLRLLTNMAFADNVRLYQRLGYVVDREEEFMGGTTLYLTKTLAGT